MDTSFGEVAVMTKVNNRKVIRRLAIRELKSNRKMSVVLIASIILTCILFTALTSIGGGLMNGTQQETMRQVGGSSMAELKYVLPEDYEKVKADHATRDVSYRIIVGQAVNEDFKNISVEVNCAGDEKAAEEMFCNPTTGRLPESYDEIATSTLVLDELGLPYELGETVPITLDRDGEITEHAFTLCGYWTGEKVAMAQECWVSRNFADEYAPTPEESFYARKYPNYAGYYMVEFNFSNSFDIEGKTEKLMERLYGNSDNVPNVGINWAYTTSSVDGSMLAGGIVLIFVIFAAGYLIIYNIFHINISANIRKYGLLKTIGTTSKQIRRMVLVQAFVYSAVGIPAGLVIGVLTGRILFSSIISTLNIYSTASYTVSTKLLLLICLVSAIFTLVTVIISCRKPCKIAGNVSPIEALRYNETDINTKKETKKTGRITPLSIARNNMSRSRKKTAVVVLSLTLSMVLVNTLVTCLNGFDIDKYIGEMIIGDFVIMPDQSVGYDDGDRFFKVTPEMIDYLDGMDGAAKVSPMYYQHGTLTLDGEPLKRLESLREKYADKDKYDSFSQFSDNEIQTDIYGVPADILDKFEPAKGKIDAGKFMSGNYALVVTGYLGADIKDGEDDFYEIGDTVTVTADGETKSYEVMARCSMPYALSTQMYPMLGGQVIIPDSEYFKLTENRNAISVMINARDGCFDEVDTQLRELTNSGDSQLMLKSKQTYLDEFASYINMIKLVGSTLSIILALIGILNFINSVVTGIISRKRELAMMNAVGMTGRQIKQMLTWEGIHYAILTAICSVAFGTLISRVAVNLIAGESFFFTYHFTLLPILAGAPILIAMSVLIPLLSYRMICKDSIVDRLREIG